jgi:hypothetical protein
MMGELMAKYRKRPVIIDAVVNTGEWPPFMVWLDSLVAGGFHIPFGHRPPITRIKDGSLNIETREGIMRADVGDYVILGVKGEFYPCKPDIFAATYDLVEEN